MSVEISILVLLAYLSGAMPWAVWLSKAFAGVDPRATPDGNPGATNAFRQAGWQVGLTVLILDFLKGFIFVAIARWGLEIPDYQLFWIALAPSVGHAFSVFLRFRGGRGLTTIFGVWTGLTLHELPLVMGITAIVASGLIKNHELRTVIIPIVAAVYFVVTGKPTWMILLVICQLLILLAKISVYLYAASKQPPDSHKEVNA